ncbi:hypothetical protein FRY74_06340 [Vicingus serpentipes]|uniref:Uncharacterized protein n=1 Tax=Vicingus serpentipes TaxID=1926625 RepID=A0A5C6RUZ5_9FLAO|nr:hypothetical protein [Vicingus serpentipes]TXB66188.1 hypothetical protein FRY74_06340 [Vicingus serpentipes]
MKKPLKVEIIDTQYEFLLYKQPNPIKIYDKKKLNKYTVILDGGEVEFKDGFLILTPLVKDSVFLRLIDKSGDNDKNVQIDKFKVIDKYLPFIGNTPIKKLEVDGVNEALLSKVFNVKTKYGSIIKPYKVKSFMLSYTKDGKYIEHIVKGDVIPKKLRDVILKDGKNTYFFDKFTIELSPDAEVKVNIFGMIRADKMYHGIKD